MLQTEVSTAVRATPRSRPPAKHQVHFYESSDALGVPAEYIAAGLASGGFVFAITKDCHSAELRRRLQENFVDAEQAIRSGRLTFLSAEEACESICLEGEPEWERFDALIGQRIRELGARQIDTMKPIRIWGEMVDVLRSSGRVSAAIRIEEMWNKLSETESFATLCSYDVQHLASAAGDIALVESLHGRTHDSEAFLDAEPAHAKRARELEATIEQRLEIEDELREQSRINANLVRIATALTSELDLDVLVQKVTDEATALCHAQFGAFFHNVESESGESYMLYTLSGAPLGTFSNFPKPRKTELIRPTFEGTAVVRCDDVTQDPRYGKNPPYHGMPKGHLPVRSYLAVPVKSRSGQVLGGLLFGHTKPGVFTSSDEQLAVSVAGQAAVAMDNASLLRAARRAEAIAQSEREILHQLFKQSPAIITILRGPELVCDFLNDAALAFVHQRNVIGQPLRGAPELVPERLHQIEEVYRTGHRWTGEAIPLVRAWSPSQPPTERFFNLVFEPFRRPDGVVEGVMTFGFDVTEQVLSARKLEALAKELELANRMKDEFLATVSHELRTPLNAILGWVRMLRTGSLPMVKWERALETIERNANAQTQLIEDLLDVGRIISGKLRLEVADVDLASVIENAIDAVRPAAEARCIEMRHVLDRSLGTILGDKDRLQQVVWNLLTNAVKFTPKGGAVTVELHQIDGAVEITVTDTGQGIEPDFVQKIFERFRQVDATPARKQGGLGLGLAIVRHLVELHGGSVRAESAGLGKGATFTVVLPVTPLRSPTTERPPALRVRPTGAFACPSELEGLRVLVVDDEADARELLAEILGRCRAEVLTAETSAEALRKVAEFHPDVIVSDIGMPEEDGYVFIKRLRALSRDEGGKTPAIALTAYARVEDRTKALVAGFNMHVPKPVEPTELLAVLRGLVTMFAGE